MILLRLTHGIFSNMYINNAIIFVCSIFKNMTTFYYYKVQILCQRFNFASAFSRGSAMCYLYTRGSQFFSYIEILKKFPQYRVLQTRASTVKFVRGVGSQREPFDIICILIAKHYFDIISLYMF